MQFKKYASIENSYQKKYIERILLESPKNISWIVTEKIHGANFSFHTNGKVVRCAKRSGFVCDEEGDCVENFYNYEKVKTKYLNSVLQLYNELITKNFLKENDILSIYGEIFGGKYIHESVERIPGVSAIQKEVQYHPNNEFIAFDVAINGVYLDWSDFITIGMENTRINRIPIKFITEIRIYSNFLDALNHDVENMESTIPGYYGLPYIENNFAEGVVIKPSINFYLYDNDRVLLKKKTAAFNEKSATKEQHVPKVYSEAIQKFLEIAYSYVTDNRLNNVLSKEGWDVDSIEGKEIGKAIGLFSKDVIEDFLKENMDEFSKLEKSERQVVTKGIATHAAKHIKKKKFGYE